MSNVEVNFISLKRTGNRFIARWECRVKFGDNVREIYGAGPTAKMAIRDATTRLGFNLKDRWIKELVDRMQVGVNK